MSDIVERLRELATASDEIWHGLYAQPMREAAHEIERLRAERDALAKDAARYRWLKSVYFTPGKSAFALVGPTRSASELDATIDAARTP